MKKKICTVLFTLLSVSLFAQLPEGFVAKKLTGNNIKECVKIEHASDGRIFLAERSGNLKQLKDGVVKTIHSVVTTDASEQGLLGIALHSDFSSNGKLYLYYTDPAMTRHYLDVIVLNSNSEVVSSVRLMEFDPIINGFHNGGAMVVKNGFIYLCIGESNSPQTAQQLDTYRGKVLRLTDDGQPAPGNPYYNTPGANRQQRSIWAIGMRNPWSMNLDPVTQKLFVINVGGEYEEINDVTSPDPAKNYDYGWGSEGKSGASQDAGTILPVFAYNQSTWSAKTCAITTGIFFNPPVTDYPAKYRNKFYFTDWCTAWIRCIDIDNPGAGYQEFFPDGFFRILGTSVGIDGNIYYSEYADQGNIWRLEYTIAELPEVVNQPVGDTLYERESFTFRVSASGTNPLSYQWQKNSINIKGATTATFRIDSLTPDDAGLYRVVVSNASGADTSAAANLIVKPYNAVPVVKILSPTASEKWRAGQKVSFSGMATDGEDGILPVAAFNWDLVLVHKDCPTCEHQHPGPEVADGVSSGSFIADNGGESSSNIWFRLFLTAKDSDGRTGKDSIDIHPAKVDVTVTASKPGLQIVIGSQSVTPYTKNMVVNTASDIDAVTPQTIGDTIYSFVSWDHGGLATQTVRIPEVNTTFKANFKASFVDNTNIALKKKAFSSSDQNLGNNANKAVDGMLNTRWESQFSDPQWISVNLGEVYHIARVKISWENAKSGNYLVQVSTDSVNWTTIKSVTNNNTPVNDLNGLAGTGKYIRIYGISRTTQYGHSIWELEVFGVQAELVTSAVASRPQSKVNIYPNPAGDLLSVKGYFPESGTVNMILTDMYGNEVNRQSFESLNGSFDNVINLEEIEKGMYLLKVVCGDEIITRKLVKE
jgi:glucose/arabinose dehydrogenase